MSDFVELQSYPTEELLELSFAAHRVNNGYVKNTRRFSEDKPTIYSNKESIQYTIQQNSIKHFLPDDFVPLSVTEEDRSAKNKADQYMKRYMLLALGNLSEFHQNIVEAYNSNNVTLNKIGLIAYLPSFVERELQDKIFLTRLKTEFANSQHFESNIDGTVEILSVHRVNSDMFDDPFYVHIGAIEKNLVSFSRKEGLACGCFYNITAKVKRKDYERKCNLPMTNINYVKLKK
jgi:hypothetical protein